MKLVGDITTVSGTNITNFKAHFQNLLFKLYIFTFHFKVNTLIGKLHSKHEKEKRHLFITIGKIEKKHVCYIYLTLVLVPRFIHFGLSRTSEKRVDGTIFLVNLSCMPLEDFI